MKKNDIFTFTAPNNFEEETGIVVSILSKDKSKTTFLCYGQHKLFTYYELQEDFNEIGQLERYFFYGETLVNNAILPDYDAIINQYYQDVIDTILDKSY